MARSATEHIRVSEDTKESLERIGSKGDTFDDIIRDLITAE